MIMCKYQRCTDKGILLITNVLILYYGHLIPSSLYTYPNVHILHMYLATLCTRTVQADDMIGN